MAPYMGPCTRASKKGMPMKFSRAKADQTTYSMGYPAMMVDIGGRDVHGHCIGYRVCSPPPPPASRLPPPCIGLLRTGAPSAGAVANLILKRYCRKKKYIIHTRIYTRIENE